MKTFEQLELHLWQTLQDAQAEPVEANLGLLWKALENVIGGRDLKEQLEVSAEAILQIAGLVLERSRFRFEALVARYSDEGPVMPADAFDRYVRQSMEVDFDQFVEAIGRKEHDYPEVRELYSVVEEISKEEVLEGLDDEFVLEDLMERLEHDENIEEWVTTLQDWMRVQGMQEVKFFELMDGVGLSGVKVWLALLLGDFKLRQDGVFYDSAGVVVGSL
jgi:hypothetical protein